LPNESRCTKLFSRLLSNIAGLFLATSGSIILAWVGWLTWSDMTSWGKDIALIFFGSRTGEAISLGIGMKIIYYFLIGLTLLLSGLLTFLRRQSKRLQHFGYLARFPKNTPILQDLIKKLARERATLVAGLTLITILGVSLYLSPLRGNTVAVVGVFASLSAIIIALLATVEIQIINVEEENIVRETTSHKENLPYVSYTARQLNFSYTNMSSVKTSEFDIDVYSSKYRVTLSSHNMPTRANSIELSHKNRQAKK